MWTALEDENLWMTKDEGQELHPRGSSPSLVLNFLPGDSDLC